MKRKMLISIALVTIMLLNCMMPLLVHADVSNSEVIRLNSKLYKAIKSNLYKEGIVFESDDITHTITISPEEKAKVLKLNLNESAIYDITGLDAFSSVTHLELSGNNLSKNSNLGVLNSLTSLNYLDLSTNQLDDVSDISDLISELRKNGTVILSGQTVTQVKSIFVDSEEESDQATTASFELPGILELAGYLKSVWKEQKSYSQRVNPTESVVGTPYIEKTPMYVTSEDKMIKVTIADEDTGAGYLGMVKFSIYIYDDATEAAQANNPNKASENILNGSRFYLYYIVHDGSTEAITTMDTNLYNAIKQQLTGGQLVNPELSSYPYEVDKDGNMIYEEFTYTTEEIYGRTYRVLTNIENGEVAYVIDPEYGLIYEYDGTTIGDVVNTSVEEIEFKTADEDGNVSIKNGYRVAYLGKDTGETLYKAAYDEAKTFVISDLDLTNKITSLVLNNKQIRDLSGIEHFIGLNSELNVSHNYLRDIEPIYDLQAQKDYWEQQMIEKFTYWLRTREYGNLSKSANAVNTAKKGIETEIEAIEKTTDLIFNTLVDAGSLDSTAEDYKDQIKAKSDAISNHLKSIYGYTEASGEHVDGNLDKIEKYLNDSELGLNLELDSMYEYLDMLYQLYNNKYKLTTFLADNLNYMTYAEYEAYENATKASRAEALSLLTAQINYMTNLERTNSLSEIDKLLLTYEFGINFESKETETPLADYFKKLLENTAMNRITIVNYLNAFREIGLYSEMANYCLIERMNQDTPSGYCYEKDYLEKRIEEFELEEIPFELEQATLETIERYDEDVALEIEEPLNLFEVYVKYTETVYEYTDGTDVKEINMCKDEYLNVDRLSKSYTTYRDDEVLAKVLEMIANSESESEEGEEPEEPTGEVNTEAITEILSKVTRLVVNTVDLTEKVEGFSSPLNELYVYDQLMSLSNKLINGNVQRYVLLPDLKKLDISYNAELENLEGISALKSLYELNAAYCYIADVTNVVWAELANLRRLNLAYNYISDISPITELKMLKSVDLSNNLIEGKLDITEYQYEKLFKKLEELNLSGNKITDITSLIIYLDHITNGNYANYIAQDHTIDINLNNQKLSMEIEKPINLSEYPTTVDIELPKIFTQLLAIDTARTAFGENSQDGRIESEGTFVTLNTRTEGDKVAEVVVKAMSGNGTPVDTCVGEGTTLKIKYKVVAEKVTGVTVTPNENVVVEPGKTVQFTAKVEGENLLSDKVEWIVLNNTSEGTTISEDGLLVVAEDESSAVLNVKVIPVADRTQLVEVDVTINTETESPEITDPENPGTTDPENPGTAEPENPGTTDPENPGTTDPENPGTTDPENPGTTDPENPGTTDPENPGTTDPENPGTTDPENPGTTDPENPGTTDPENPGTAQPEVDEIDTATLGYTVGEEYLTAVKAKTSVEDFARVLLNGKEYNVVIKKEDKDGNKTVVTEGNVGTGMYVQVQDENGNVIKDKNGDLVVYEIVVKGDINGDGIANSLDSIVIKAYRNEVTELSGSAKLAADINDDGKVNVADSKLLLYHRAEVTGYDLNFKK